MIRSGIVVFCLEFLFVPLHAFGNETLLKLFNRNAPVAWAAYEEFAKNVEAVVVNTFERTNRDTVVKKYDIATSGESLKAVITGARTASPIRVFNPKYFFGLALREGNASPSVAVLEATDSTSKRIVEERDFQLNVLEELVRIPCSLIIEPLSQRLLDPNFQIDDISHVVNGSKTLVRLDFTVKSPDPEYAIGSGSYVLLDPDNYWCVHGFFVIGRWFTQNCKMTYGEPIDGFPVLKKKVDVWEPLESNPHKTVCRSTWVVEKFSRVNLPESKFTLSEYGLPEPDVASLRNRMSSRFSFGKKSLILVNIIAVLLLVGALVWRKRRKSGVGSL